MNIILCEKNYFESNWCQEILSGLKNELKKRRIEYKICFKAENISPEDTLYIIGSDFRWISESVLHANRSRITPVVVFNQLDHIIGGRYHSVSSDIGGSVALLIAWLKSRGRQSICLYGINPASVADMSRAESYMRSIGNDAKIFYNRGSLKKCFDELLSSGNAFDAVICANDFAAASLVNNLSESDPDIPESIDIISCSRSAISQCYSEYIRSVNINFASLGANAYTVARAASHGENVSEISLKVKWDMAFADQDVAAECRQAEIDGNEFYSDREFTELLKIDTLMERCDELDIKIIKLILKSKTYIEIADECHIVEQSVKYRVKQYTEICQVKNRKELERLLNEYRIKLL